jgi:hypothetical protein
MAAGDWSAPLRSYVMGGPSGSVCPWMSAEPWLVGERVSRVTYSLAALEVDWGAANVSAMAHVPDALSKLVVNELSDRAELPGLPRYGSPATTICVPPKTLALADAGTTDSANATTAPAIMRLLATIIAPDWRS